MPHRTCEAQVRFFYARAPGHQMDIFDYDNVLLLPRKCRVESRSECETSTEFGGRRFNLPVVPANMKTVVDEQIGQWLAANGYFYVMHRFDLDNVIFARRMRQQDLFVSISSGVRPADHAVIDRLAAEGIGADYITIDIAHGRDHDHRDIPQGGMGLHLGQHADPVELRHQNIQEHEVEWTLR